MTSVYGVRERDLVSIRSLLLVKSEHFFVNLINVVVWKGGETGVIQLVENAVYTLPVVFRALHSPTQPKTLHACTRFRVFWKLS